MPDFPDLMLIAGKQRKRGTLSIPDLSTNQSTNQPPNQSINQSLDFKPKNSSKPVSIRCLDIEAYLWYHSFDGYTLGLKLAGGAQVKLSQINQSINQSLLSALEKLAAANNQSIKKVTLDTKGSNIGEIEIADRSLTFFSTENKPVFDLPFHSIQQAVAQSRNEVALELHADDAPTNQSEQLVEIRMFIPEEQMEDEEMSEEREAPASIFAREIQVKGDLGDGASTSALADFSKLLFAVPRGRYDVELFGTFFKLSSATYTYKIAYKNVNKMFLFELKNLTQHLFVIGLNPPVRQGRTAYPYLVVQFDSVEELEQHFPNIDEKTAEEKYQGMIKPFMKGFTYDVVTRVFKSLSGKKVLIASLTFSGTNGGAYIQCSYKANEGHLFFLEKSFFFVKKPPMHIRHTDIQSVAFDRLSSANKRFAITISATEGGKVIEYGFTNIDRELYDRIHSFMEAKGLSITSNGTEESDQQPTNGRADFSEDAYMNRIAGEAAEGGAEKAGDDSDSENDEDFTAGSDDESSSGGSDESGSDDEDMASEASEDEAPKPKAKSSKGKSDKSDKGDKAEKSTKADKAEKGKKDKETGSTKKRAKESGSEDEEEKKPTKPKVKKEQPKKKKQKEEDD